ncbi:MAG: hypothetical protein FWD73_06925 [Polyangiaceae bacterium]|nr:hypothetical protein [Polyangiaceae bacterium]
MANIPSANVTISAEAGALAGGTGYCVVIAPVAKNDDATPRVFSSWPAVLSVHGYAPGVDYAALHIGATGKPVLFVGVPIVVPGVVTQTDASEVTGTSVVTISVGENGALEETDSSITVVKGGTVGTDDIRLLLSCDGGVTKKSVRLGTLSKYEIPYFGITIEFGPGTLNVDDVVTFSTSAPKWDGDGIDAARKGLSLQQKLARSWLVIGDIENSTEAKYITEAVNTYETAKKRFTLARANIRDRHDDEEMSIWVSAMDAAFASVDSQKRISLGLGRLTKLSPITGWFLRRPVQWAASIREYQHDIHHPTWAKEDGPLLDWGLEDADGRIAEYDDDNVGGALAARFTCARTWGNGPIGAFIAMDLTRADEATALAYVHNMNVANVCCTVVQTETENIIGKTPVLDSDGHPIATEIAKLELGVNTDLEQTLLTEFVKGEGPRASYARWTESPDDVLNVPDAAITGIAELQVNGTVVHVNTLVAVS